MISLSTSSSSSSLSSNLIGLSTTLQQFDTIRKWLLKNHKKYCDDLPSNKNLSQFLQQFVQFQEDNLGKNAPKPTPTITRLPFEILTDFGPGGALCHLFSVILKYKHENKISKFELQSFGKKNELLDLCSQVETCLIENQRLVLPKCYIKQDLFNTAELQSLYARLVDILKKHKGQLADSVQEADHVIYPPSSDETSCNTEWIRVIKKRGKDNILVHRLFTPDSQDQWLNNIEIDDEAAGLNDSNNSSNGGSDVWEVTANWLLDTDLYNEWMNQEDYEVDVELTSAGNGVRLKKPPKMRKTLEDIIKKPAKQSKRSPSPSQPNKRRKRKLDDSSKDEEKEKVDLTKDMKSPAAQPNVQPVQVTKNVNVKKEQTDFTPYRNGTVIDLDEEQNQNSNEENKDPSMPHMNGHHMVNGVNNNNSSIPFNNNTNNLATANGVSTGKTESSSNNTNGVVGNEQPEACEQTHHIIVPSYAAWFDYTSLHEIEKRALPEFFNQKNKSKTPEIYLGYRNFMIDTYRLNPGEYLSATACRRNLPGDVCAILRVHAFLEQWGLINYQVDYESRAAPLGPPCTSHFTVLADTPSGLAPITGLRPTTGPQVAKQMIEFSNSSKAPNKAVVKPAGADEKDASSTTPSTTPAPSASSTDTSAAANSTTTAAATTTSSTTNVNSTSSSLSVDKLNVENFGLTKRPTTNGGLINSTLMRNHEWTDQELLLLLEGLEMFKDDWNKVCEHVGTRTQDECILKFLQLPIEDPYLDSNSAQNASSLGPLAFQPIPFSQSGNPVMSTIAFLASVVDPRVASAAAKAAIAEFSKMKDEVPPQTMETHLSNVLQAVKDGKKLDNNYNIEQTGIAIVNDTAANNKEKEAENKEVAKEGEKKAEPEAKQNDTAAKSDNETTTKEGEEKKAESSNAMEVDQPATAAAAAAATESKTTNADDAEKSSESKTEQQSSDEAKKSEKETDKGEASTTAAATQETTSEVVKTEATPASTTTTTSTTSTSITLTLTQTTSTVTSSTPAQNQNTISELELKNAAASALAAAAVKARQLALTEEKKIKSAVSLLVETQLKKLEIKLRHFEELEAIMDRERENLEHQRQQLVKERQQFQLEQLKTVELRQRQMAAQNLLAEGKLVIPTVIVNQVAPAPTVAQLQPPQAKTPQPMPAAPTPPPQQQQQVLVAQQQPQPSVTPQPPPSVPSPAPQPIQQQPQQPPQSQTPSTITTDTQQQPSQVPQSEVIVNKQLPANPSPAPSPSLQQQQQSQLQVASQPIPVAQTNGQPQQSTTPPLAVQPVVVQNVNVNGEATANTNGGSIVKSVPSPSASSIAVTDPSAPASTTEAAAQQTATSTPMETS